MGVKYLLLVLSCIQMALACGHLCISCDTMTNNCYMCAPFAQRKDYIDCECQNGYTDRGNGCQNTGWTEDFFIFFGVGVFFAVFIMVVYYCKKKNRSQQQYTRMQDDGMPYGAMSPVANQYAPNTQKFSICYNGGADCQTSCGHPYHRVCLDRWTSRTCAVCHQNVPQLATK